MEWILPLLGGLGIGAVIKSVIDQFNARRAVSQDRHIKRSVKPTLGYSAHSIKQQWNHQIRILRNLPVGRHGVSFLGR